MKKEEILEKSRQENKNLDERERDALARAGRIATAVGAFVCTAIILLETLLSDRVHFSTWAVFLAMTGTTLLVKYIKLKKVHELIFALLQLAVAATFFVFFVLDLVR